MASETEPGSPGPPPDPTPRTRGHADALSAIWLDSVEVRLAGDRDNDGYHSRIVVTVDADSDAGYAEVYASIALVDGAGRLAVAHDTASFGVDGRVSYDGQSVEFELLDDFPADRYGLYVELRDAYYGDVLDGVGANEFYSLGDLRLEGVRRDGHDHGYAIGYGVGFSTGYTSYSSGYYGGVRDDYYTSSYGAVSYTGAADPGTLALLALAGAAAVLRRVRRAAGAFGTRTG